MQIALFVLLYIKVLIIYKNVFFGKVYKAVRDCGWWKFQLGILPLGGASEHVNIPYFTLLYLKILITSKRDGLGNVDQEVGHSLNGGQLNLEFFR